MATPFDGGPVVSILDFLVDQSDTAKVEIDLRRTVVLTQTCDLANEEADVAIVASVFEAQDLVERGILKPADVKGPIRSGRTWGLYFLPAQTDLGLGQMIVDLHRLHTVRLDLLRGLCRAGKRKARVPPLYREHLAKQGADTFSRIGLPRS